MVTVSRTFTDLIGMHPGQLPFYKLCYNISQSFHRVSISKIHRDSNSGKALHWPRGQCAVGDRFTTTFTLTVHGNKTLA
jgi:hypothetical protein